MLFELFVLNSALVQVLMVLSLGKVDEGSIVVSDLVVLLIEASLLLFLEFDPVKLELVVIVVVVEGNQVE